MSYVICHMSIYTCHMSYVICNMSYVICHMSYVVCHMSYPASVTVQYVLCLTITLSRFAVRTFVTVSRYTSVDESTYCKPGNGYCNGQKYVLYCPRGEREAACNISLSLSHSLTLSPLSLSHLSHSHLCIKPTTYIWHLPIKPTSSI
jgi:hypothetical protein